MVDMKALVFSKTCLTYDGIQSDKKRFCEWDMICLCIVSSLEEIVICDKCWLTKEASKAKVNETWVYANITSQIGKLAYEIEFRIQIDKEDFIHDINQYEFKVDG